LSAACRSPRRLPAHPFSYHPCSLRVHVHVHGAPTSHTPLAKE
jgi:hypothetical protein